LSDREVKTSDGRGRENVPKGTEALPDILAATAGSILTRNPLRNGHSAIALGKRRGARAMNNLHEYQIRFLDTEGVLLKDVPVLAESLSVAIDRAAAIGVELGAADFFVTSNSDSKDMRPRGLH
jgi:hypothetical protein